MRKLLYVGLVAVILSLGCTVASANVKKHALAKAALAPVKGVQKLVTSAPKAAKVTLGSVVFAVEAGNDVVYLGLTALDKAASMELKHNPFHYAAVVDGKVDSGLEYAEQYFFGAVNP
jgi:hypothetical protein